MMRTLRRVLDDNRVFAVMLVWLIWSAAAAYWPASFWLEVRSISAGPAHAGQPVPMLVDRVIHRPFIGEWTATVRRWEPGRGFALFCAASGRAQYRADAQLPALLTLNWWTNGTCSTLPAGRYFVSTSWEIRPSFPGLPAKSVTADSNIFEVSE